MNLEILQCGFERIEQDIKVNIAGFRNPFDSFLENHIMRSSHYEILVDSERIGYFSIRDKSIMTQFHLEDEYIRFGQELFSKVLKYEEVREALVYTSDELFLSHALEKARKIDNQAYFFKDSERSIDASKIIGNFRCRPAKEEDIDLILERTEDFFDDVERQVKNGELYVGNLKKEIVSFGIIERSHLFENVASIGMIADPIHRNKGIGRNTLLEMKRICKEKGIAPIAGCWYYNHNSKKTLESAGMCSETRLLAIHF